MGKSFVEQYDRWICNEAWKFVRRYNTSDDLEDYIQIAREAAWQYCTTKGIDLNDLTPYVFACIRQQCFHCMWDEFCKRYNVGVNKNSYKKTRIVVDPVGLDNYLFYDKPYDDPDNTLLITLKSMVNDEWGDILQEVSDGYKIKDIADRHGLSVQLLQYYLRQLGEVLSDRTTKVPKKMRRRKATVA